MQQSNLKLSIINMIYISYQTFSSPKYVKFSFNDHSQNNIHDKAIM